jgi:hypothetical protein
MACLAEVLSVQMFADILRPRQIATLINRGRDDGRQVPQPQMKLMVEAKVPRRALHRINAFLILVANWAFAASPLSVVALQTVSFGGQVTVACRGAILYPGMTV